MTAEECYAQMGGDYSEVLCRLVTKERVVKMLALMLKDDSIAALNSALERCDYEEAFRTAHSLKGVALNLGLKNLSSAAYNLTEALRPCQYSEELSALLEETTCAYTQMRENVAKLIAAD